MLDLVMLAVVQDLQFKEALRTAEELLQAFCKAYNDYSSMKIGKKNFNTLQKCMESSIRVSDGDAYLLFARE